MPCETVWIEVCFGVKVVDWDHVWKCPWKTQWTQTLILWWEEKNNLKKGWVSIPLFHSWNHNSRQLLSFSYPLPVTEPLSFNVFQEGQCSLGYTSVRIGSHRRRVTGLVLESQSRKDFSKNSSVHLFVSMVVNIQTIQGNNCSRHWSQISLRMEILSVPC